MLNSLSLKQKQILSVVFTIAVYTAVLGGNWKVALLLAIGVGFHEYGHLWAAKKMGMATKGFFLMPFMGGVALVAGRYRTYAQQAFVVIMGPIWGAFLAMVSLGVFYLTHQPFFLKAACWMAWLNMMNLLPLSFLDGGQLMGTITYSINRTFGMVCHTISTAVAAVGFWFLNPVIAIIVIVFGGTSVYKEIKNWWNLRQGNTWLVDETYMNHPRKLKLWQAALTLGVWFTLGMALLFMTATIASMPGGNLLELFK